MDMSDPIVSKIVESRIKLLFKFPFFGHIALKLQPVEASKWCKTVSVDGKNIYYNRDFVKGLEDPELLFIMGHLILHCVFDHLGRRGSRKKEIWDAATDYIVNYTLVKFGLGVMPKGAAYSDKFTDEMSSEEVYEILLKNSTTIQMPSPFDEHSEMDGEDGDGDGQPGTGRQGKSISVTVQGGPDGPPQLTDEDLEQIRSDMRASVVSAAQSLASSAGKVPLGVQRMIDEFTSPIMNWKDLIEAHIQSQVKGDYTFNRPSRRSWSPDGDTIASCILPGQNFTEKVAVAVAIDASGSMSEQMLRDLLSEVKGIMDTFEDFEVKVWTYDTRVYEYHVFTPENIDEIYNYPLKGGGGTMFECNYDFMRNPQSVDPDIEEDEIVPAKFINFTDGYPNSSWGDPDWCDTLFVIHGTTSIVAPFGMTAYYQDSQ